MSLDFIRLHNADTNTVVIVNVHHISLVDTDTIKANNDVNTSERAVSKIYMSSESDVKDFKVNESAERIFEMINELKHKE